MSLEAKTLKVCSCNRTVALDAKALAAALKTEGPLVVHEQLCRWLEKLGTRSSSAGGEGSAAATGTCVTHSPPVGTRDVVVGVAGGEGAGGARRGKTAGS